MKDNRLKMFILALANCIVYSCCGTQVGDNTIIGIVWSFSQYMSAMFAIISVTHLLDLKTKKKLEVAKWVFLIILILGIVLCAFICSSDLQNNIKKIFFVCEVIMVFLALIIHYMLSHSSAFDDSKNIKEIDNEQMIEQDNKFVNKEDILNINGDDICELLYDNNEPLNKKRQVKSAIWIVICSVIMTFDFLVLPLILKCKGSGKKHIILCYVIAILMLISAIFYKNKLYFDKWLKAITVTIVEAFGVSLGCISDAYFNVYIGQLNLDSRSVYFFPYVVMGVAIIPFLVSAQKIIENYKTIFVNRKARLKEIKE